MKIGDVRWFAGGQRYLLCSKDSCGNPAACDVAGVLLCETHVISHVGDVIKESLSDYVGRSPHESPPATDINCDLCGKPGTLFFNHDNKWVHLRCE